MDKIKIYTITKYLKFNAEQLILFGLRPNDPNESLSNKNHKNESRFHGSYEICNELFTYVSNINDCDVVVLPYKFENTEDKIFNMLYSLATKLNKKFFCFYVDDNNSKFNLANYVNMYFFRSSFDKSTKLINEYAFPTIMPDFFENNYITTNEKTIGYRGNDKNNRMFYLKLLNNTNYKTNFEIYNQFFVTSDEERVNVKKLYIQNIQNNLFTFVMRGYGNYSYRFFEVFMMGRIPIIINTDCEFPFEKYYNIYEHAIIIENDDLKMNKVNIEEKIDEFCKNNDLLLVQKKNRMLYEKHFSVRGILQSLTKIICDD